MNLTSLALRNAQFVIIILLILIVVSTRSFLEMPRSEDPQVNFPIYIATIIYPGTSPEDMETLIVDPIEDVLKDIRDITDIRSDIAEGIAFISIDAEFNINAEDKYNEIVREINSVRGDLPEGIIRFTTEQVKPAERVNYKLFAIASPNISYPKLYEHALQLEDRLEQISGINDVVIDAMPDLEVRISLDFERMAAQNISLTQVAGILQQTNVNLPGGDISAGAKNFSIKSSGSIKDIEAIKNTVIAAGNGRVVYLRDIATVEQTHEEVKWIAEMNKEKCIFVGLKLRPGFNIFSVDEEVSLLADEFKNQLPPNIHMQVAFEQVTGVQTKIDDFFKSLLQGILFVGIVILLFLGWRSAFIIITLVPICIILALAVLNAAGFGLQQISIAALVLALGLLVDNGIVVIENINRFIKEGYSRGDAALKGANEVGLAVLSSTVTTILSFFPLTQLGEAPGLFLQSLPLTVIFTLIISFVLALTFSPIMSKMLMSKRQYRQSYADKFFTWFTNTFYLPVLKFSLRFGWFVILVAILITAGSISLFPKIGVSFFPTADKALLLIDIDTPQGSSLDETENAARFVESLVDTLDIVDNYVLNIGSSNPQIYYNRIPKLFNKQHGQLLVNLKDWDQRQFHTLISNLRKRFKEYAGAKITVEELKNGAPIVAPIEIRLLGNDLNELTDLANSVERILESTEGVINIINPLSRQQTVLNIMLDKEKAGLLNVSSLTFDQTIRASLNGLQIDEVTLKDQEDYNVVLRMPFDDKPGIEDLDKIYVANRMGRNIPLRHIASIEFDESPPNFAHYNFRRYVAVTGSLKNLDNTLAATDVVIEKLDQLELPPGTEIVIGGEYEEQQSTFGNLGIILILAQIAIFAVLVLQFRSAIQPLIIFAAIPLAICGSFVALYLTGWPFSFFAFIGLISLIGIVVNNSIIMVDYINQLRLRGEELIPAIIVGSTRRFKPILLTTMTTILGLLPLTLQRTNQWSPLCWTIIGGMISSTLLSLLVVPILYKWFSRKKLKA